MLIPIHYGKRFTFTMVIERRAEVVCVSCLKGFCITDYVGSVGHAFSILGLQNKSASQNARNAALKNMGDSITQLSPVPCPYCGAFQPSMKRYLNWILGQKILFAIMMLVTAAGTSGIACFMLKNHAATQEVAVLAGAGSAALAFLAYRYFKDLRLNPVEVEQITVTDSRPPLRVALRENKMSEWTWLDS